MSESLKCGRWLEVVSTNLRFIHLGFGLRGGLRLGHTVGCRQDHSLCELCARNIKCRLKPTLSANVITDGKSRTETQHLFSRSRRSFPGLHGPCRLLSSSSAPSAVCQVHLYSAQQRSEERAEGRRLNFSHPELSNSPVKLTSRSSMSFSSDRFGTSTVPLYFTPVFDCPVKQKVIDRTGIKPCQQKRRKQKLYSPVQVAFRFHS